MSPHDSLFRCSPTPAIGRSKPGMLDVHFKHQSNLPFSLRSIFLSSFLHNDSSRRHLGQSMLEYSVLIAAVTAAMVIMSDYVRKAFNAHAETIEEELNGATE